MSAAEPRGGRASDPGWAHQPWSIRLLAALIATVMLAGVAAAVTAGNGADEEATGPSVPTAPALGPALPVPTAPVDTTPTTTGTTPAPASEPPAPNTVPVVTEPPPDEAAPVSAQSWLQSDPSAGAAAHRMIVWTGCPDVVALSDAELDEWRNRGAGGFVCQIRWLRPFGGDHDFTGDANHPLDGESFQLQRRIRDSRIVERAAARGLKLYLGFYLVNYGNGRTPLAEWFDDTAWSSTVLPALRNIAGAAHVLGFAGLALDQELYPQRNGATATWSWNYPSRAHAEGDVRSKVRQRGAEMMEAVTASFPDVELVDYATYFPESWNALVQLEVNDVPNAYVDSVQIDLLDGLTSVEGYRSIRFMDATFYKTPHLSDASWDTALQYDHNRVYSLLSRRLSNWAYASTRIHLSPFAWINAGGTSFERARAPEYVAEQLDAFRRWGLGGEFANYAYDGLDGFDYGPYEAAMRAAASPGVVDDQAPALYVTGVSVQDGSAALQGYATDNMAVRVVGWSTSSGSVGAAAMTWRVLGGDYRSGYDWQTDWAAAVPLVPGPNQIVLAVQDAKGHVTTQELVVDG